MSEVLRAEEVIEIDDVAYNFDLEAIDVPPEKQLHLTLDRKVSPDGWYQSRRARWVPTVPNSFGLPAGLSCPGKTEFCNDCYAVNSENSKGVKEAMQKNWDLLQEAGTIEGMTELLIDVVARYSKTADTKGIPSDQRMFRIHWDGDFFSKDYAQAWANTVRAFPEINFWVYTRSFVEPVDVLPQIVGIPNLAVFLSTDKYNVDAAHEMLERYPGQLQLAACSDNNIESRELVRGRRAVECPENIGKLALMEKRKDGSGRGAGACVTCDLCPGHKADILFATGNAPRNQMSLPLATEVPVGLTKRPVAHRQEG